MKSLAFLIVGLVLTVGCSKDSKDNGPTGTVNHAPTIQSLYAAPPQVSRGASADITCIVTDEDNDSLTYSWRAAAGTVLPAGNTARWTAPNVDGIFFVSVTASDGKAADSDSVQITVLPQDVNNPPVPPYSPYPPHLKRNTTTTLTLQWECYDVDGDRLSYDLYFGAYYDYPPPLFARDLPQKGFQVIGLRAYTTYYWKVVARDAKGAHNAGQIWRFDTGG